MPTQEEIEERITESIDDRERELAHARSVIRQLDTDRLDEIISRGVGSH